MGDVIVLCPERLRELEKRIGISTSHCTILVERINYLEVILFGKEQKTNPLMPLATRLERLQQRVCHMEQQLIRRQHSDDYMEDNDDGSVNDYVPDHLKPWIEKVENALYFNDDDPATNKRIQCKTWSWYYRFWQVIYHFYGAVFPPDGFDATVQLLVNDVLGPGHLPMPTTGDRGFTWYEYMHAMVESTGFVAHPDHMGMTIIDLRYHLRSDFEVGTEADEFSKTNNTKDSQLGTPLVELLSEAGRWFGYWNSHTKKFTDGCAFPSEMTALEVLRFLEKKAGFERIPIRTEYEDEEPGFWGRVKRVETRWSYRLENCRNDYVYVPGQWMINGQDPDKPYEDEPKVPIVKRLSIMLFLQKITFDKVHMDSEIDDGAVENENDNEAVVWRIV